MMKLSLMKTIVPTLTATGESALANQLLSAWPHDPGTATFLRASANTLFTFTTLETDQLSDQPAWAAALRKKLERKVQGYSDECIAYTR